MSKPPKAPRDKGWDILSQMTQPNQSNLDKKLDEVFGVYIDPQIPATTDETVLSAIHEAKQAIKQLIADEMSELLKQSIKGANSGSDAIDRLRTKLAEWLKETI